MSPRLRAYLLLPLAIVAAVLYHFRLYALGRHIFHLGIPPALVIALKSRLPGYIPVSSESRVPFVRHIVAVGDIHGDLPNAQRVLSFSGVTDPYGNWSGNVDFFVQTGDIIDRGDDTIALFSWMEQLRAQALAAGSTVISTMGNHEWMNAIGDWRYVRPSEIKTFGDIAARMRMISTGRIGRSWAANYTTATRLPLHPALGVPNEPYPSARRRPFGALEHAALSFVHGGLSPTYADLTPFPTRINAIAAGLLQKVQKREQPLPHPPYPYPGLPLDATEQEKALYATNGPLWYRGWALEPEERACAMVGEVLKQTGTRRMIMGHTLNLTGIVARCEGRIIIIDTGITPAYGGVLSALSVRYMLIPVPGGNGDKWVEREVVSALYPDHQEVLVDESRDIVWSD